MSAFEFDGEKYQKASKHQQEWGNSLVSELTLNGNEAILDLGCGDGRITEQLALLVPDAKVVGIDASIGMIETAMQRARNNLTFIQLDINSLDYHNTFDVIFSNAALHWIKDHKKLLANSYSALRDNGILLWDFAGNGNCSNFFAVVREKIECEKYKQYFYNFEWPWYMPNKDVSANFLNNFFGKPQKSLILRAFSGFPNFRFFSKNGLLHHFYTISTPICAKTTSHAGTKSGCLWGACSHKGSSGFGPIRRQPRPNERSS